MSLVEKELRARNLKMLGVLAGESLAPLAVACWVYYGTDWRPVNTVNHGELIHPARPLPAYAGLPTDLLRHKWSLVYIGDGQCDDTCRTALVVMRQTRLSLNNEMDRVARVFLVTGNCCAQAFLDREHPGLKVLAAPAALGQFPTDNRAQTLFIVDPLGNLMKRNDIRQNP